MMIAAVVLTVLLWLSLAVAGVFALWIRVDGWKTTPVVGIAIALAVGLLPRAMSRPVVIVRDAGGTIDYAKKRLFGSQTYRFAIGETAELSGGHDTIIVNDTARPIAVKTITYGRTFFPSSGPTIIDAQSIDLNGPSDIDYFGPTDAPPKSISVNKKTSSGFEIRHWLTW